MCAAQLVANRTIIIEEVDAGHCRSVPAAAGLSYQAPHMAQGPVLLLVLEEIFPMLSCLINMSLCRHSVTGEVKVKIMGIGRLAENGVIDSTVRML